MTPADSRTDNELLLEIATGSEPSLRVLYERYGSRVYNTALGYLHLAEDAEEITQDTFIEIFRSAGKFEGRSSVRTWMYRIVIHKSLDALKRQKRKRRISNVVRLFGATNELEHDVPNFFHPGVELELQESNAILFRAIDELPEQQRSAYLLSKMEGESQVEIAGVLGCSEKAVESLLQRAKMNLRKSLECYYPERRKSVQTSSKRSE